LLRGGSFNVGCKGCMLMDVTATEFKNRLGQYLDAAEKSR